MRLTIESRLSAFPLADKIPNLLLVLPLFAALLVGTVRPASALGPSDMHPILLATWHLNYGSVLFTLAILFGLSYLVFKFYREVKSRRLAELAANDSRDQIEISVVAANLGLWDWDPATDMVWTSDHCRKMLGLEGGPTMLRDEFLDCLQGEERALAEARMTEAMLTGKPCEAEYSFVQPDGTAHWVASRATPRSRRGGKPDHLLGVLMDITSRKQAEQEAVEQRKQLTHLTRVSVLGALSGALAHELNQPLTAILSNAQAARRILSHKRYDIEEIRQILEDIVADDMRAGDIITHLRSLLRKDEMMRRPVDMNKIIDGVLAFSKSDLALRGVRVTKDFCEDCALIDGDPVQLQQVVLNLFVNAGEAMSQTPAAGKSLHIVTEKTKDGKLRVSVTDTGEGISESSLQFLFEPFHTTKALGLGLGLPICNWIIMAHGGRLFAQGNPGGGATFAFELPLPTETATAAKVTDEDTESSRVFG
ncbi:PAS domain-containing protein [Nordella sp. HKS 07]|uniref:PAS domain-containing sensor histidine kinase n=1 Tax=Nordella sp. HKS 07 TaxID=2712222 RepID=UPI0013E1D1ED|nr:ATP-binding protein [Nordella sp. HKS 07]QIG47822.1 PAS domain-containing protein [Nordella sp. HKS 07]